VEAGLVSSLAHPGANLTGVFFDFPDFGAKWLELLREAAPNLSRIAVFWDPSTGTMQLKAVEAVATSMGFRLHVVEVNDARNVEQAFRTAQDLKAEEVVFLSSPIFGLSPGASAKIAFEHKLPAISMFPEFAKTGGLLAYGPDPIDLLRQTGTMVGKVLAGIGSARRATCAIPTRHQSEDGAGARAHYPDRSPDPRRRGDRMSYTPPLRADPGGWKFPYVGARPLRGPRASMMTGLFPL
jgi:ABC-type uncharacterized transport system substrate-binding protein